MTEEQIHNFQRILSTLDIRMYDSENPSDPNWRSGKTIASINNITSFDVHLEILHKSKNEYLEWLKDIAWGFEFKEEALLFLKKQQRSFEDIQNFYTYRHEIAGSGGRENLSFELFKNDASKELLYHRYHTFSEIKVFREIFDLQKKLIENIIASIKDLVSDVNIHSNESWAKKKKYDGSNPWIIIGENFKLTDPDANFKCAIDRHQAVLLFDYFQKAGVFFPYKKAKDISTLRYYLTGHSDDFFRKNVDADSINSMKKDGLKNNRKKNESGVNLSGLHELLSYVLLMIEEDQELFKEKIKTNN
ncbi:MAG: hypothetical protein K9H64_10830 [Bacteroidales bacterium]|nr:hypothetical protein [Bacteroidales bacterium]MCF8456408.1 hypothetical protein [Bacteroidales bacterium]